MESEHKDIVELLLKAGADPDLPKKVYCKSYELAQYCTMYMLIVIYDYEPLHSEVDVLCATVV